MESAPEAQEENHHDGTEERDSEDTPNMESTWTIIDAEDELESAMFGLSDKQMGRSLLADENQSDKGGGEGVGDLISQRSEDSVQLEESMLSLSFSSEMTHSHSTVNSTYMQSVDSIGSRGGGAAASVPSSSYGESSVFSEPEEDIKQESSQVDLDALREVSAKEGENKVETSASEAESVLEERAVAEERNALHEELARLSAEMAMVSGERCALMQQQAEIENARSALAAEKFLVEKEIETVRKLMQSEREALEAERVSFEADREAFLVEQSHKEQEMENVRKERQYWQSKCMESAEGVRNHEELLVASINSIRRRVQNLSNEARHCRLLAEEGGRLTLPDADIEGMDRSVDSMQLGTIETGLEDAELVLSELENEFIPLVSRWHSQVAVCNERGASSRAPKISLSSFEENDIALFFPTPRGDYLAFNAGAPHHYLSAESKALIGHDKHFRKIYVLGKIVFKEEKVATRDDSPYHLAVGVKYFEVSVTSVTATLDGVGARTV
mmetsp:Transcript_38501/g.83942  ORF Transcript_38501/g.83942 Transcript_38501/m.83942 type:complete len:502 (-) Transcript_38501:108-1613(-)